MQRTTMTIRRRPGGAVDTEYYAARARRLRGEAFIASCRGARRWLARLLHSAGVPRHRRRHDGAREDLILDVDVSQVRRRPDRAASALPDPA